MIGIAGFPVSNAAAEVPRTSRSFCRELLRLDVRPAPASLHGFRLHLLQLLLAAFTWFHRARSQQESPQELRHEYSPPPPQIPGFGELPADYFVAVLER